MPNSRRFGEGVLADQRSVPELSVIEKRTGAFREIERGSPLRVIKLRPTERRHTE